MVAAVGGADCQVSNQGMDTMAVQELRLLDGQGRLHTVEAHIADDQVERAFGYQHICGHVIDRTAILFVYGAPAAARFHMRNVKAPLDIGFFDGGGALLEVQRMRPWRGDDGALYSPGRPFQFALEARAGYFQEHGLTAGRTRLLRGAP